MTITQTKMNIQRSRLIMPAHNEKFTQKAYLRNADCIVLDLEDSVPMDKKKVARELLSETILQAKKGGSLVAVRVNNEDDYLYKDLEAAIQPGLDSVYIPKVENANEIIEIENNVKKLEEQAGIKAGSVKIDVLIESAEGLHNVDEILGSSSRIQVVSFGAEDFSKNIGIEISEDTSQAMLIPRMQIILAAKKNNVLPIGLMGSIANYNDLDNLQNNAVLSKKHGYVGASCVHPSNVDILNNSFSPNVESVKHAKKLIEAFEEAQKNGESAINFEGKMVDVPHYENAKKVLHVHQSIQELEEHKKRERERFTNEV